MGAQTLQSCLTLCDPVDHTHQAPLSMGFPRQEYGSGLPSPPLRDLPDPGIEPTSRVSPALGGGLFAPGAPGKPLTVGADLGCIFQCSPLSGMASACAAPEDLL